jgi:hypothetical protein
MKISLLHATRNNPDGALATREHWLSRATDRERIEHIFAIQDDDIASGQAFAKLRLTCTVTPAPPSWASSSVANWNAAAEIATGDWLVCIADDLTPPPGWDSDLAQLAPIKKPVAVFVPDQLADDCLLRHPVMNRALYEKRGFVFDPDYYGVFCDNDLTLWCRVNKVEILRATSLKWYHDHPITGHPARPMSEVTALQNSNEAYAYGRSVYERKWPALVPKRVERTHSVWIGERLSLMERLTLAMMVAHGHKPTLWVDETRFDRSRVTTVPEGVTVKPLPDDVLRPISFTGKPHPTIPNGGIGSFAQWSDYFGLHCLANDPGSLWCQLDIAPIQPLFAAENTFTRYVGGITTCCHTLRPDLALAGRDLLAKMITEDMAEMDWHDTMTALARMIDAAGALVTGFPGFYDCGGRLESPFNLPVAKNERPHLVHWSNATQGRSKNHPVPGSLYAELVAEYLPNG